MCTRGQRPRALTRDVALAPLRQALNMVLGLFRVESWSTEPEQGAYTDAQLPFPVLLLLLLTGNVSEA